MKPGDRRKRWNEAHTIGGGIMMFIGAAFIFAGITNTASIWGTLALFIWGGICIFCAFLDFRDAKRGWEMRDEVPPYMKKMKGYKR